MPRAVKIHLDDGSILTGAAVRKHQRDSHFARRAYEEKIYRAYLKGEVPESIQKRFGVSAAYVNSIVKTMGNAISPTSRAEIEVLLLKLVGNVVEDHYVDRDFQQSRLLEIIEAPENQKFIIHSKTTSRGVETKTVTRDQALVLCLREVRSVNKHVIDRLTSILPKEFVLHLGDQKGGVAWDDLEQERKMLLEEKNKVADSEVAGHA